MKAKYGVKWIRNKVALTLLLFVAGFSVAKAETLKVAAFGDSLVAGYGLPVTQGFVAQLQRWMDAGGHDVQIWNYGVSGDTTYGGLSRLEWTLTPDIDLVVVELGANEFLRGMPVAPARDNLDKILAILQDRNLPAILAGFPAPNNFGEAYKAEFDAIYPDLARKYGVPLYPNFVAGLGDIYNPASIAPYLQADGLHPNEKGVARIVDHFGPFLVDVINSLP